MRARNHSTTGRFTGSTPADSFGAFGAKHRRDMRQKEKVAMMRELLKRHGATDEQLDKTIPVMVEKPIDDMPTGMIRGLEPALAVELAQLGAVRFLFKPSESAPPMFVLDALEELAKNAAEARDFPKLEAFMRIVADAGRAKGASEAEIEERLAGMRQAMTDERDRRAPVPEVEDETADDEKPTPATDSRSPLAPLTDDDAIALIQASGDVEQLEGWLELEHASKAPRAALVEAIEARVDALLELPTPPATTAPGPTPTPAPAATPTARPRPRAPRPPRPPRNG